MNFDEVNPYKIIEFLKEKVADLEAENEELRKRVESDDAMDESGS